MEHLYNPDQMSEQEIKATFVARQAQVDRLVTLIERQPEGAGVRHVVLVAPRGMGKTTMLLMVQFAVSDRGLTPPWLPIRFPEELYGVTDLADFWLETLENVARAANDDELSGATARLKARYPGSEQLQEATLALLRDWCRQNNHRLVLLVDNFHLILSQINDEQQSAALRHVLMNEGWMMILGAAPSFFKEASRYDEPLYNFFQIERLERLTFEDMRALLLQRAAADGLTDFEKTLDANTTRLRVLEYFTGGNARLALMLYQIITRSEVSEVRRGLELLLDQVTPYYKDKTEALPAQQRKILDHIARTSGQTHEGVSPSEIAQVVRLTPQVVSAQLKRLTEQGYVQPANLRGRSTFYTLSEPLYSLWYQMRFGRDTRQRMGWLVSFLRGFYTVEELGEQGRLLATRFQDLAASDSKEDAKNVLDFRRWIAQAMDDPKLQVQAIDGIIQSCLRLHDVDLTKEILSDAKLDSLSLDTLAQLLKAGYVTQAEAAQAFVPQLMMMLEKEAPAVKALILGLLSQKSGDDDKALLLFNQACTIDPNLAAAFAMRGVVLSKLERLQEALESFDKALALDSEQPSWWASRGWVAWSLGKFQETVDNLSEAEAKGLCNSATLKLHGLALGQLGQHQEAVDVLDRAFALDTTQVSAPEWFSHGSLLQKLGHNKEALVSFNKALTIDQNDALIWWKHGHVLNLLDRHEEALDSHDKALELRPSDALMWLGRGVSLAELERYEDSLSNFDMALSLIPKDDDEERSRVHLIKTLLDIVLNRHDAASRDWKVAIKAGEQQPNWKDAATEVLIEAVRRGYSLPVRQLIAASHMEQQFFPLTRALDYLATGDEALIQKLTPEMRPIVEEVVAKLRPATEATDIPSA